MYLHELSCIYTNLHEFQLTGVRAVGPTTRWAAHGPFMARNASFRHPYNNRGGREGVKMYRKPPRKCTVMFRIFFLILCYNHDFYNIFDFYAMLLSPLYTPYGTWVRYIYGTPSAQKIGPFRNIFGTYYNIVFYYLSIVLCV